MFILRLVSNMVMALANIGSECTSRAVMATDHTNNFIQTFEWKHYDVLINVI